MADEEETQAPEANAMLGEAEATVIEPGGTDNSMESETTVDESVNVNIVTPEPSQPEAHSHEELAHCEHCEEHANRLTALEAFAAGITAELEEVEEVTEEAVGESEAVGEEGAAEEPPAEEEAVEDEPPKRVHLLHRKLFG